jgi:hypothetical protein
MCYVVLDVVPFNNDGSLGTDHDLHPRGQVVYFYHLPNTTVAVIYIHKYKYGSLAKQISHVLQS